MADIAIGDRVRVTSIRYPKPKKRPRIPSPVGTVEGFEGNSVVVRFDELVNGLDTCSASRAELRPA